MRIKQQSEVHVRGTKKTHFRCGFFSFRHWPSPTHLFQKANSSQKRF